MSRHDDDYRDTRDDYPDDETRARVLWGSGRESFDDDDGSKFGPGYEELHGTGPYVSRYHGVMGPDKWHNDRLHLQNGLTHDITKSAWFDMFMALVLANCRCIVLNSMVNISWSTVGIVDAKKVAKADRAFRASMRTWLTRQKIDHAWVWCLENGKTFGVHSHILVYVPYALRKEFAEHVSAAVKKIAGRRVVNDRRRKVRTVKVLHARDRRLISQWRIFRYMSKGIDTKLSLVGRDGVRRTVKEVLGLKRSSHSAVTTKRSGVSRSLHKSERDAFFGEHGTPENGLHGATGPHDVFGDQYLTWGQDLRKHLEAEKERERTKRMFMSLELTSP